MSPSDTQLEHGTLVQPDVHLILLGQMRREITVLVLDSLLLAVEVLSPGSVRNDRGRKHALYQRTVPEYWLIDAVNFGKLAREGHSASREDLAAALMTLVGQVIAITAINATRAERVVRVVVIGHMTDMKRFRKTLDLVGDYYGMQLMLPKDAGFGTALGALFFEQDHVAESQRRAV